MLRHYFAFFGGMDLISRPSLRWLREQQRRRKIPFVKVGARVWFKPNAVRAHLDRNWTCKAL